MTDSGPSEERLRRSPPATTDDELVKFESALGTLLPDELVRLYKAANGYYSVHGQWWVISPLDQMADAESWLRPFDGYLDDWIAFGDDGTGDPYCFHRVDQSITLLSMIDRSHERVAIGLPDFSTIVLSRV
ncbi:SMI1/KNR4 family protein [Actinopolymorpha sp. B17G11]|uniref:SMI1/KNR4 family protein n=1 Tax=Actinopolymorpha sp. B17G11 TaxID=3160861 RepID=UPI0032E460A0